MESTNAVRLGLKAAFALALLLSGGALADPAAETQEVAMTVDEILTSPLNDDAYRRPSACVFTTQIDAVDVLDDETLVFRGRSSTWINRLPKRCPGLRKDMMVSMQVRSYRICAKQWFRGMERGSVQIPSSMCALGVFDAVDASHIDRLTQAIEARRRTTTVGRTLKSAGVVKR